MRYTSKEYWNNYWQRESRKEKFEFYFADLLDEYIEWNKVHSYLEIGGAPGSIMAYINKKYGLHVSTIDFSDRKRIECFFQREGIIDFTIYEDDFIKFDIKKLEKYDIVASWGFLEHFDKSTILKLILKEKEILSDNGYLIIEIPNIRKVMWLIYFIFNRKVIKNHNIKIMNLRWLKSYIEKSGLEIVYASYYFAMNTQNSFFINHRFLSKLCMIIVKCFKNINISDAIKKWFYPYIVIIAKKI